MADGLTTNTRMAEEEIVTVLCAIKDSKHRSFYALWKITRLFGDISTEDRWILIIVAPTATHAWLGHPVHRRAQDSQSRYF